jgi:hypothetical protein
MAVRRLRSPLVPETRLHIFGDSLAVAKPDGRASRPAGVFSRPARQSAQRSAARGQRRGAWDHPGELRSFPGSARARCARGRSAPTGGRLYGRLPSTPCRASALVPFEDDFDACIDHLRHQSSIGVSFASTTCSSGCSSRSVEGPRSFPLASTRSRRLHPLR